MYFEELEDYTTEEAFSDESVDAQVNSTVT